MEQDEIKTYLHLFDLMYEYYVNDDAGLTTNHEHAL